MPGLRQTLSIYFAFQFVRGPGTRAALLEQYEAFAKMMASRATAEMVRRYVKENDDRSELSDDIDACVPTRSRRSLDPREEVDRHTGDGARHQ